MIKEKVNGAFRATKNITKYHLFDKKEGSIVDCMKNETGRVCTDEELNDVILNHFCKVNGQNKTDIRDEFVPVDVNIEDIENILLKFKRPKAEVYDSVSYHWFICHKACLESRMKRCKTCRKKIGFVHSIFTNKEYWQTELSKKHFEGRLICLNKAFPKTPERGDY